MKKTLLYLILAAGLVGCARELTPATEETLTGKPVTFEINVLQTKAVNGWEAGDMIYVFFKGLGTKYLTLTFDGSTWTNETVGGTMTDEDFAALSEKTLAAVHIPVAVQVAYDSTDKSFNFTSGGKPVYTYYLADIDVEYTVEEAVVNATLELQKPEGIAVFFVPDILEEDVDNFTLGSLQVQPVACVAVSIDGTVEEEVLQPGARMKGFSDRDPVDPDGYGAFFAGRLIPKGAADYTFSLADDDTIYTLKREGRNLEGGKMYKFPPRSDLDDTPTGSGWSYQLVSTMYVDLGLPSGVKWAKCNLGATGEKELGDYFAWGENSGYLNGKTKFSFGTYYWMTEEGREAGDYANGNQITKYTWADDEKDCIWYNGNTFIGDGKASLQDYDKADDAAYAALGGKFRMPTSDEWAELRDNCTWEWVNYSECPPYGGVRVTSNKNSNSILLPAASTRATKGIEEITERGSGFYWSSSLNRTDSRWAHCAIIGPNLTNVQIVGSFRSIGLSVRPVYKE